MTVEIIPKEHCEARRLCRVCRNREGGRAWREKMWREFGDQASSRIAFGDAETTPGQAPEARYEVDFECPFGLAWGAPKPPPQPGLADQRIEAHCRKCEFFRERPGSADPASQAGFAGASRLRRGKRCILYLAGHCTPCQFRAYLNRPGAICPAFNLKFEI